MTPIPFSNRSSSPSYSNDALHQHLIDYIACLLTDGVYARIPAFHAPSPGEKGRLLELWAQLQSEQGGTVLALIRARRGRRPDTDTIADMEGVVRALKRHSLALEDDPSVDMTTSELRSLSPDLSTSTTKSSLLASPPFKPFGAVDADVLALAQWFKSSYMRWIDPVPCPDPECGGKTKAAGSVGPTQAEQRDGAGRVELHLCVNCGAERRFARYGKVRALTRTREGRCGEWAQLFYTFLRVKGIESRYIWNSEDHVWCEYWSPALQHWVHVDPCEAATNKPLLYARGWGKKQAYCLAFGPSGAEDVTRAYVDDYDGACRGRRRARGWKEVELRRALHAHTVATRLALAPSERTRLEAMDSLQQVWMGDEPGRLREAERMELGGRVSGPEEWRKMRDEMGVQSATKPKFTVRQSVRGSTDSLSLFGDARLNGQGIILTTSPGQTAAVYNPTTLDKSQDFRCAITFRLTSPPGAGEADGIALVFSGEKRLGLGGYGLGYEGVGGQGDFAIEVVRSPQWSEMAVASVRGYVRSERAEQLILYILTTVDTYRTQDHADDPPTPHISLHSPPKAHHRFSLTCTEPGSIPFLSDGREYTLEVIYRAFSRNVVGYLDLPDEQGCVQVIDALLPLPSTSTDGGWYVGVSGACGGLWQKQEITDWKIDLIDFDEGAQGTERAVQVKKDDV